MTAIVLNGFSGRVWVASTCSTSLVPMPKASAPNAPWVEVCESPQTMVMPGWVRPELRADDVHDALLGVAEASAAGRRTPRSCGAASSTCVRETGSAIGWSMSSGRDVVVLGGERQVGPAHRAAGQPQPVEGLRAGDLVHEVQVDVEQVGLALGPSHDVRLPDLLGQRACHRDALLGLASQPMRRQYRYMDNSSGVGVLDKAAIVLGALEAGPASLAALVQATGLARPTAHRLAIALEHHRLVARDLQGRFVLGPRLRELATAAGEDRLLAAAGPGARPAARHHRRERAALPPPGRQPGLRRRAPSG